MIERGSSAGHDSPPGVAASLRGLVGTALAMAQARLQLLANELEEQGIRGMQLLALAAIAFFCAAGGVLLVTAWIVIALWEDHRLLTVGVLAGVYFACCAAAQHALKDRAARRPSLSTPTGAASNSARSVRPRPTLRAAALSRPGSSVVLIAGSSEDNGFANRKV